MIGFASPLSIIHNLIVATPLPLPFPCISSYLSLSLSPLASSSSPPLFSMTTTSNKRRHYPLLLPILLAGLVATMVQGQVTVVSNAAFTRYGTNLYAVGGGFTREIPNKNRFYSGPETTVGDGQLIVLDLSTPWDGASPPWKRLANGPKQYNLPAAFNANGTKLVAFHSSAAANNTFGMIYDVAAGTWSNSTVTVPKPDREGIPGVTDPDKDTMYLATGYNADEKGDQMYMYNFATDKMFTASMNGSPIMNLAYFAGAWNSKTKSIMYFGGNTMSSGDNAPSRVTTYNPYTNNWESLVRFLFIFL